MICSLIYKRFIASIKADLITYKRLAYQCVAQNDLPAAHVIFCNDASIFGYEFAV